MSGHAIRGLAWLCLVPAFGMAQALASPPFVLDDGDVQDTGHVEIDFGPFVTFGRDQTSGAIPALEADVGVRHGVEADIIAPIAVAASPGHSVAAGAGDVELEAKVRVVDQRGSAAFPSIALGPTLILPTGSAPRGLGQGHPGLFLPLWFSKDLGRWTVFGGGGPTIGHGDGGRDFVLFGAGLASEVTDAWHVGLELYETTRSASRTAGLLSIDADMVRDLSAQIHLFAAVGRGVGGGAAMDHASVLAGVQMTE